MDKKMKDGSDNSTMIMIGVGILALAYFYNQEGEGDSEGEGEGEGGGGGGGEGEGEQPFGSFGGNSFNADSFNVDSTDYSNIIAFEKFNRKFGAHSAFLYELAACEGDKHYTWADGNQTRCTCSNDYELVTDESLNPIPMFDDGGNLWNDEEKNGYYVCRHNLPTDWNRGYDEELDELFYYKNSDPTSVITVEPEFAMCTGNEKTRVNCLCQNSNRTLRTAPEKHPETGEILGFLCTNEAECGKHTCTSYDMCWNNKGKNCDDLFNPEDYGWGLPTSGVHIDDVSYMCRGEDGVLKENCRHEEASVTVEPQA